MNNLVIWGNLTRDPELRSVQTQNGPVSVCNFTVAVNRRNNGKNEADFFRVTTWRGLAENCKKYLAKGRGALVRGAVSVSTYTGNDGVTRASLDVNADDVRFTSPRQDGQQGGYAAAPPPTYQNEPQPEQQQFDMQSGYLQVENDDLPF